MRIALSTSSAPSLRERRAAFSEASRQYGEWTAEVCARGTEERARTGKMTHFLQEVLAYFDALPVIEQMSAPEGYIERLRADVVASGKDDIERDQEYFFLKIRAAFPVIRDEPFFGSLRTILHA